jgi:hypothetical protein
MSSFTYRAASDCIWWKDHSHLQQVFVVKSKRYTHVHEPEPAHTDICKYERDAS